MNKAVGCSGKTIMLRSSRFQFGHTKSGEKWLSDGAYKSVNQYNLPSYNYILSSIIFEAKSHKEIRKFS